VSVREAILMACLAALGVVNFREQSAGNRKQLDALMRREERLSGGLLALRHRGRALRLQTEALCQDRYYVERVARADLGWRPSPLRDHGPTPPQLLEPPTALVQTPSTLPPMVPRLGAPAPAPGPRPPQPLAPDPRLVQTPPTAPGPRPAPPAPAPTPQPPAGPDPTIAQPALASLGYISVEHFQSRMMRGRSDGQTDDATLARARQLNELLRRLGFGSVRSFQQRNRLTADGVMGRRTEQRALALLRQRAPHRSGSYVASSGRSRRGG